jgi:outer membrane protein assembly factor BamD
MKHPLLRILFCCALLTGCATAEYDRTADWSAKRLYDEAAMALDNKEFDTAIDYFEKLEARYPFGRYALQARLDLAFAYYKAGDFDDAIVTIDRFIKEHPRNAHVDYAYYLRGLSNYNRGSSVFDRVFDRDLSKSDPVALRNAFGDFDMLVRRFPESEYAPDARQRLVYLRNNMAKFELDTARWYYERGALTAAINRVKYLLENYSGAPQTGDALALLAESYTKLGETGLAGDALRVLKQNFPAHPAVKTAEKQS